MEEERSIEVRSVDGSSTVVRIAPERTIAVLQSILKESFPPAKEHSNFRLFHKGVRLRTGDSVGSHLIDDGFLVLVPFAKRVRESQRSERRSDATAGTSNLDNQAKDFGFADSAWMDMVEDLRSISDIPQVSGRGQDVLDVDTNEDCSQATTSVRKETCYLFLRDFMKNHSYVLDRLNKGQSSPAPGLADCLSDRRSQKCFFSEEFHPNYVGLDSCACPVWLKRLVRCFSFLNAAHSFLLMQHRFIEWKCLNQALELSDKSQVDEFDISDVEQLLFLFPKVVIRGNQKVFLSKYMEAIVILDCSEEPEMLPLRNYRIKTSHASSIYAREKREDYFKDALLSVARSVHERKTSGSMKPFSFSLEDIITFKHSESFLEEPRFRVPKKKPPEPDSSAECLCQVTTPLQPLDMVGHLHQGLGMRGQIAHIQEFQEREAVYVDLPSVLSDNTISALKGIGISQLYSHQADAVCATLGGKNIVVATSTSSGKSLCYNIPVFEELSRNAASCALYLFPTKALAQDQLRALHDMTKDSSETIHFGVYDGDTPELDRTFIQNNARLIITNPDMLHVSILPFHQQFKRILSNLRFIVIDEAHVYKGAFGSHTSLIIRRLCRICSHVYGRVPSFIFCTATSANPQEHVMELGNLEELELISNDGSPCGPKHFLLWNPPLRYSYEATQQVQKESFDRDEVIGRRSRRQILRNVAPDLIDSISVYRAGYTAKDRRCIENDLFGGKLRGIAATNALELGIDVGHIDVTLHLGFPGSFASFWQQAGRSGRRLQHSLSIFVAFEGPLDQYFMKFPKKLFENPIEHCQVDAYNSQVLEQHIMCASLEHPLCIKFDEKYFGHRLNNAISNLQKKGYLSFNSSCNIWSYMGPEKRPAVTVGIRAIEAEKYAVVDIQTNQVLDEIEESKAFFQVHEGAVYINQGATYLIRELDLSKKLAFCQKADVKYYTQTRDYTDVHVYGSDIAYPPPNLAAQSVKSTAQSNQCRVTTRWFGFHRIKRGSNRIFDSVDLSLPPYSYESTAVWIQISRPIRLSVEERGLPFRAGQHAASHALLNLAPRYVMCNVSDLSTECGHPNQKRDIPDRLLLFDQHPGGMGLSSRLRDLFVNLLCDALELIRACSCSNAGGCPDCIQNASCREYNHGLDKQASVAILEALLSDK
ncbi:UBQ, helicase-c and DEAD-like helicase domain-containing protein isoform X2 [Wolffia australiana]